MNISVNKWAQGVTFVILYVYRHKTDQVGRVKYIKVFYWFIQGGHGHPISRLKLMKI